MQELDEFCEFLKDGKWHKIGELEAATKLPKEKMEKIIRFFVEYHFMERKGDEVRMIGSLVDLFSIEY